MCFNGVMQRATWINGSDTIEVGAILDTDGDYDVWPLGSLGDRDNWTVFASELASGQVQLVPA